jgi:hypothetical protein
MYKTFELPLAIYLWKIKQRKLLGLEYDKENRRTCFVFEDEDSLERDVLSFYNSDCLKYAEGLRAFKSMLKNLRTGTSIESQTFSGQIIEKK